MVVLVGFDRSSEGMPENKSQSAQSPSAKAVFNLFSPLRESRPWAAGTFALSALTTPTPSAGFTLPPTLYHTS